MAATFQNSATVLSIGIFFCLMILGLASSLGTTLNHGLIAQGVSHADAARISHLPPVATLFASLLGYNPIQSLLGPSANSLSPAHLHYLTGREFFPHLISGPFQQGLQVAFVFAIIACLIAAGASWLRGGKYHYDESADLGSEAGTGAAAVAPPEPLPADAAHEDAGDRDAAAAGAARADQPASTGPG